MPGMGEVGCMVGKGVRHGPVANAATEAVTEWQKPGTFPPIWHGTRRVDGRFFFVRPEDDGWSEAM